MDNHLESINTSLGENTSMLKENTETSRENTTILRDIRGFSKAWQKSSFHPIHSFLKKPWH